MSQGIWTDPHNVAAKWCNQRHRLLCTHAVLFKVKLNARMFGGRWLTQMHWCAHRLWPKSGECEWAMESVFPAQSNMLRPLHRKVTYSHLYRHPSPSSSAIPLWNAGFRCLSPVSRCQSAAFHYTPALCSGRAKKRNLSMRKRCVTRCEKVSACGLWMKCILCLVCT